MPTRAVEAIMANALAQLQHASQHACMVLLDMCAGVRAWAGIIGQAKNASKFIQAVSHSQINGLPKYTVPLL